MDAFWRSRMLSRRHFLKVIAQTTAVAGGTATGWTRVSPSPRVAEIVRGTLRPEDVLSKEKMRVRGEFYEATIPDTLDLADRARLSVNNLTHNVDPNYWFYVYQVIRFGS